MGQPYQSGPITVVVTGKTVTTSGTSANAAIPFMSSGTNTELAKIVRVSATTASYFRMGTGTPVAVLGDLMVQPGDAVLLTVPRGVTNFAALQVAAAGVLTVTPVES